MQLSHFIDHTLLKPDATNEQILKLCQEAVEFGFYSVCVNSRYVSMCSAALKGSPVKVCSVVGFPLGAMSTKAKAFETLTAVQEGASEIDMVCSVGDVKSGAYESVLEDIKAVVEAAQGKTVKVILETSLLTDTEKRKVCELSVLAKAQFVKTSTGFGGGGATLDDIRLMKEVVGDKAKIKASGGIKTLPQAEEFIKAGATRLGTSSGVQLAQGQTTSGGY